VSYHIRDATKTLSDTPRTDAAYFKPHSTMYDLAGEMKRIERELTAANERIRLLISERDTARGYADQKWKLRQEFHDLFGTDDISEAVALVRGLQDRIKRLEEAGGQLMMWIGEDISDSNRQLLEDHWNKAKEAKP
jgi:hypothetical protein